MTRKATLQDLEQLTILFDSYRVFYKKQSDIKAARNFLQERLELNDSLIYVHEQEGILTGFTQLYPLFSSTRMKKLWLLNDLFVNPKYRGQGISLQLLESGKELAKKTNACGVMLETEKTNEIGNQLYPRAGFELNEGSNFYEWTTS
ncbi:GNAT family N-acetyltransferase [Flammeovirga pacifica]|uniref:GNAT family N-acetyltransferase n=1 Tax=Flammeovirga pacifica TaxID=915059 RepID=A0A1S1Z2H8_FLAPC|nr:GNAT family N-acetyltransferase [Flammeovirga pacifica]OHX67470.1 GNAT family N-acetyltransferase [Flammeovirga pacifica]